MSHPTAKNCTEALGFTCMVYRRKLINYHGKQTTKTKKKLQERLFRL